METLKHVFTSTDGVVRETIQFTHESVRNLDTTGKVMLGSYVVAVFVCFSTAIYIKGKIALNTYRSTHEELSVEDEFNAVAKACRDGAFRKFLESLCFYPILASIMPKIVLALNPSPYGEEKKSR